MAIANKFYGFCRGSMTVRSVDNLKLSQIDPRSFRSCCYLCHGANENWHDQSVLCRFNRSS